MNNTHISSAFDRDLEGIQMLLMKMGGLVESAILDAAQALETRDGELAEQVRRGDQVIDALEEQINVDCARVIALRAPTATDLRTVLTVIKIAGNLERCGDYAKNLAKRSLVLTVNQPARPQVRSAVLPKPCRAFCVTRWMPSFAAMPCWPKMCACATAMWIRCTTPSSANS
jgi:phosphate uptake regulator